MSLKKERKNNKKELESNNIKNKDTKQDNNNDDIETNIKQDDDKNDIKNREIETSVKQDDNKNKEIETNIKQDNNKNDIKNKDIEYDIKQKDIESNNKKDLEYNEIVIQPSGWMVVYQLGIAKYIKDNYNINKIKLITASSAGSTVACSLLCDTEIDELYEFIRSKYENYMDIFKMPDILKEGLEKHLPNNCVDLIDDKLVISCCNVKDLNINDKISDFKNKEELIDLIMGASHIPLLSGIMPYKYKDKYMYDGNLFNSFISNKENELKILISGYKDDNTINPGFEIPLYWFIYPPNGTLKLMYKHGYNRAEEFFNKNSYDNTTLYNIKDKISDYQLIVSILYFTFFILVFMMCLWMTSIISYLL